MHVETNTVIREIEEHSFRSGPSLATTEYDGWILREADGHTKRANSVNFLSGGTLPLEEKIKFCEDYYARLGQPSIFRLTPLASPIELDRRLARKGYNKIDPTDVCLRELAHTVIETPGSTVTIETELSREWLTALARLTDLTDRSQSVFSKMSALVTLKPCFASIKIDQKIVACGLGVLSDKYLGLFEFTTDPAHQRKGYAKEIVNSLLDYAYERGVRYAYLQVVQSNKNGQKFWKSIGFNQRLYTYHYRVKA